MSPAAEHGGRSRDPEVPADLARRLRQGIGAELRAEAEAVEHAAATAARRRRDLTAVGRDLIARGDDVAVTVPGRQLRGTVVAAGDDWLGLATAHGRVDVPTRGPLTLTVAATGGTGGREPGGAPATFRGRLRQLEVAGTPVEVGVRGLPEVRTGRIAVVAPDHLALSTDDREVLVTLVGISWVAERRDPR